MPKPPLIEYFVDNDRAFVRDTDNIDHSEVDFFRIDGPAHEDRNGSQYFYINGKHVKTRSMIFQ